MKSVATFFLLVVLGLSTNAQKVYDGTNTELGAIEYVDSSYQVKDTSGLTIQIVDIQGHVFAATSLTLMAEIHPNEIINASGQVVGTINAGGEVFSASGQKIGQVQYGLMVFDAQGVLIGRSEKPLTNELLAYYFFFRL